MAERFGHHQYKRYQRGDINLATGLLDELVTGLLIGGSIDWEVIDGGFY